MYLVLTSLSIRIQSEIPLWIPWIPEFRNMKALPTELHKGHPWHCLYADSFRPLE